MSDEELFQTNELSRPASSRLVHKAQQQAEKGDLQAAAKTLQRAVELDPQPAALELLGSIWMKLNQPERAIIPLAAAVTLDPKGRAIIPLAAAVTLDPKGRATSALANVFMRLRREREAHALAVQALKVRPDDRQALEVLEATRDGE